MKGKNHLKLGLVAVVIVMVVALPILVVTGAGRVLGNPGEVPRLMSYQGRLTNPSGQALTDGNYSMEFRLYNVATGGTPAWNETQTVAVSGGLFNVLLGSTTPLTLSHVTVPLYLEVVVQNEVMTPRQQLVSVPFSFRADDADTLDGMNSTDFAARQDLSTVGTINTAENPVDWTRLKNVPAGFADGVDAVGTGGGGLVEFLASNGVTRTITPLDGGFVSISVALTEEYYSGSAYDARFANREALTDKGTINTGTNPVDWTKLKDVPAGIADGVDSDTLAGISAAAGQVPKWNASTSSWVAATDEVGTGGGAWTTSSGDNIYRAMGNVGIGTNSPAQRLDVFGNATVSGALGSGSIITNDITARSVNYSTPRTHYYSIPKYAFIRTTDGIFQTYHAGVYLPDNVVITNFKVCFDDFDSENNLSARLFSLNVEPPIGLFSNWASVDSEGISGIGSKSIACNHTVQNNIRAYYIEVYSPVPIAGSLSVIAVLITYTISEAP